MKTPSENLFEDFQMAFLGRKGLANRKYILPPLGKQRLPETQRQALDSIRRQQLCLHNIRQRIKHPFHTGRHDGVVGAVHVGRPFFARQVGK